jgi:hypothetical protein
MEDKLELNFQFVFGLHSTSPYVTFQHFVRSKIIRQKYVVKSETCTTTLSLPPLPVQQLLFFDDESAAAAAAVAAEALRDAMSDADAVVCDCDSCCCAAALIHAAADIRRSAAAVIARMATAI